jgi:isopentenyl-diphosphate Delta-isomerase
MERISRKREHVEHALAAGQSGEHGLDDVRFIHNCLPGIGKQDIALQTTVGGLTMSSPIVVNAMTGGAKETHSINRVLGMIAQETGLAMAVGSQMAAVKDPALIDTYRIARKVNPKGILLANLGAEASPSMAKQAIEMIEADGLQIHLNVMQELIMPEGDRDFSGAARRIEKIVKEVDVPVIVKEVGFGISREAAARLTDCGVSVIDVGGRGGTNFAQIENARRKLPYEMLNSWGITTAASLLEVSGYAGALDVMATGGIRTAIEAAASIALGASAVGMAGAFLRYAVEEKVVEAVSYVQTLHNQLEIIMTALGAATVKQLQSVPLVITGNTYHWAAMRGIDCSLWARRTMRTME